MELGNTVFWVEPMAGGKGLEFPQSQPAVGDSPLFLLENGSTQRLLPCVGSTLLLAAHFFREERGLFFSGKQ